MKIKTLFLEYLAGDTVLALANLANAGVACDVLTVYDELGYRDALGWFCPQLVIADDANPAFNALAAIMLLKQTAPAVPFIAISAAEYNNIREIIEIMRVGAFDYLLKDRLNDLPEVVKRAIKKEETGLNEPTGFSATSGDDLFFSGDRANAEITQLSVGTEGLYGYRTEELPADPDLKEENNHPDNMKCALKTNPVEKGEPIPIGGIFGDKKKEKAGGEKLIFSEQRYRQIVETAQEGIWIIDEELLTVFVNQKLCDILGYTAGEILGKHNYDFKDEAEKEKTLIRLKNRKLSATETHESAFITKSGGTVYCQVVTNGLFGADGAYQGTLAMLTDTTQRKADVDALCRSEANLSAIIENTTDLVYSLDMAFKFITFNQLFKNTMKTVYGFDIKQRGNILDLLDGLSPQLAAKWKSNYLRALQGETVQFVNEYPFGEGKVYLSYSINPIWESGKVIGLSCFSRDITKQKLDEAAIKKSAANLEAIIENTGSNIYSLDTSLKYITFNKLCRENLRHALGIVIKPGDYVLDVLKKSDPDGVAGWEKVYREALTGLGAQFVKEFNFGATTRYLKFSINPIWENDEVIGLSCAARDLTNEIAGEMAVRKSEASLRTVFNNTDMACMLLDKWGRIVSFNPLAQKYADGQNSGIVKEGDSIFKYIDLDRRGFIAEVMDKIKNGPAINYQVCRTVNEGVKWFDMTWAGIKDEEQQDFGYIFTIRDITMPKKLEIEREKITNDIIQRNKALEQFTYIISHNLRAPVANIIGLSSLMDGIGVENNEISEIISSIGRSANKLDEVISDLNQILQVNEDVNEKIELIMLPKLVNDIKFSIRHLVEREQVTISTDFSAASEMLSVKSFVHSIFYNLILNSIKYRNPGMPPIINLVTKVCNEQITFVYKDNGRGIDTSKYADELFGLYKRFDTSVEGKGMGLFMVKMQVESLGGSISLQSTLGKGTEFVLAFPQAHLQGN